MQMSLKECTVSMVGKDGRTYEAGGAGAPQFVPIRLRV
jgi:hypothetical protein